MLDWDSIGTPLDFCPICICSISEQQGLQDTDISEDDNSEMKRLDEEIANKEHELRLLYEKRLQLRNMAPFIWETPVINKFELAGRKWSCELIVSAINPRNQVSSLSKSKGG